MTILTVNVDHISTKNIHIFDVNDKATSLKIVTRVNLCLVRKIMQLKTNPC